MDLDLPVVSTHSPNPAAWTAKFMLLAQNITSCDYFFPLSFFQRGELLLFCSICCSWRHLWRKQHPSYNSFGSWIHCVVIGCSGLSLHFSISLAKLQAVQCLKTNYRSIYPVLGPVVCYSALTELAWCAECAPLLVGQFSWHCKETCHHIFLDKCTVLNIPKYLRPQPLSI